MNLFIGKRIRELRRAEYLTQQKLADYTSLSLSAIKSYENSLREPNSKAMVALERYFNVSGAYLRGETDEKVTDYIWDDNDMMTSIKSGTPIVLQAILNAAKSCSDKEQKMINNILVELRHTLTRSTATKEQKAEGIALLSDAIWTTNGFIDACALADLSSQDTVNRMNKARQLCVREYSESLLNFQECVFEEPK